MLENSTKFCNIMYAVVLRDGYTFYVIHDINLTSSEIVRMLCHVWRSVTGFHRSLLPVLCTPSTTCRSGTFSGPPCIVSACRSGAALDTTNIMVKKQVFDLLSALCVSSDEGFAVCIDAINNYKVRTSHRFTCIIWLEDLETAADRCLDESHYLAYVQW